MKKLKATYLLIGLLGLSFNNASAISGDEKTVPGSICSAYYGKHQQSVRVYGDVQLRADKATWVNCPIVEDTMSTNNKKFNQSFKVIVNLYHPSDRKTTCRLRRAKMGGYSTSVKKTVVGAGHKVISFNTSSLFKENSSVSCYLAKNTRVMNLWWIER